MANQSVTLNTIVGVLVSAVALVSMAVRADSPSAEPKTWSNSSGLFDALGVAPNELNWMKDHGLTVGGWLEGSISANFNRSPDNFNGTVTFHDRTGEVQMNQAYLWLQKAVTVGGDKFDWGGRVDFMYGTDAIFTQAYGTPTYDWRTWNTTNQRGHWDLRLTSRSDRFYGIALPQAYAELNLPIGNGVDVKIGHFYTPLGYEVVTAPDNLFITKPYTFQYGEPFTHVGILSSYTFNPNWTVRAGAVTGSASGGWDGTWDRQLGNWAFLGGFTWTSNDAATTFTINSTAGNQSETHQDFWGSYSIVATHNITDKLHYIIQHDHGFADNVLTANSPFVPQNASWYGINQYLTYDVHDKLTVGLRAEWFSDPDGFRVLTPVRCGASTNVDSPNGSASSYACGSNMGILQPGSDYYAVTVGMNYKPAKWLSFRPNLRYDYATTKAPLKAFDAGLRKDQFLFTADMIVVF